MTQPGPRSAALLSRLARIPRVLLIIVLVALLVGGALAPSPIGPFLLLVVAALAAWLAWLTWSGEAPGGRALRLVIIVGLVVFAASRV